MKLKKKQYNIFLHNIMGKKYKTKKRKRVCIACRGTKRIPGDWGLPEDCMICNGDGFVILNPININYLDSKKFHLIKNWIETKDIFRKEWKKYISNEFKNSTNHIQTLNKILDITNFVDYLIDQNKNMIKFCKLL